MISIRGEVGGDVNGLRLQRGMKPSPKALFGSD